MLIAVPIQSATKLFKRKGVDKILAFASYAGKFSAKQLIDNTGLSRRVIKPLLNDLLFTEHIEKAGRTYNTTPLLRDNAIIVNVHDVRCDKLFKWRATRAVLYELYKSNMKTGHIAEKLNTSRRTIERIITKLRQAKLVHDSQLNPEALVSSPAIEVVPRKEHRRVLRNFLAAAEARSPLDLPVVFYGEASWGIQSLTLEIMVLLKGYMRVEDQKDVMERFVIAAKNVTSTYGLNVEVCFTLAEVWLAQKLGFAQPYSQRLSEALEGICIHGKLPQKEDYFELHQLAYPATPDKIAEWVKKGYVAQINGRYVYTDKAIQKFKEKAPTNLVDVVIPIFDKKVHFITVGKPPQ